MFRLEKVLQNDDSAYIYFVKFFKSFIIFLSYYLFSILEENSIYEILDFHIFLSSQYYLFSILLSLLYFVSTIFFLQNKNYKFNFISFIKEDLIVVFILKISIFAIFFVKNF